MGREPGIWVISTVTGNPRLLRENAREAVMSPDDTRIAFMNRTHKEIWLMGADGENARRLLNAEPGYRFERVLWSPNGQRLAYLKSSRGYDRVSLESCDLEGRQTTVMLSDRRLKDSVWRPDGRLVCVMLEPPPNPYDMNLWELRADPRSGKASGQPRRLTNWAGVTLVDLSRSADGKRLAFTNRRDQSDVYLGELEAGGLRLNKVRRVTMDERIDWPGGWTQDSKSILFYSDRNGELNLFKQGVNDATAEVVAAGPEEMRTPRMSPDGAWILYLAWPKTEGAAPPSGRLMRLPVAGDPPQVVLEVKGYPGSARTPRGRSLVTSKSHIEFRCASRGSNLCVLSEVNENWLVFSAFDPLQGRKGEITRMDLTPGAAAAAVCPSCPVPAPQPGPPEPFDPDDETVASFWDLSPDGSELALGMRDLRTPRITVMNLASRLTREISVKGRTSLTFLAWAMDGKSLFVTSSSSRVNWLYRVTLDGETRLLHQVTTRLQRPVPSPDGRYLAFSETPSNSNAWMVETVQ